MKKYLLLAVSAILAFGACSRNEAFLNESEANAVQFSTYVPKNVTKAGEPGSITNAKLLAEKGGFGVFSFYTDASEYLSASVPNFMYNQLVSRSSSDTTVWTYSPVKYWPNEDAANGNGGVGTDRLSFFAYAPYVGSFTSSETEGVTGLSTNTGAGDPKVLYTIADDPANVVDLLWGVDKTTGLPLKNLTRQLVNQKVTFDFRHSLSRMNIQIQGEFDNGGLTSGGSLDSNSKITVESVVITGAFVRSGVLNLNNTTPNTPLWETEAPAAAQTITISGNQLNAVIKDAGAVAAASQPVGITDETPKNLYASDDNFLTFIPSNSSISKVEIVYYVTTDDPALSDGYIRVKNNIIKEGFSIAPEAGKAYTLLLKLGMNTVKMSATVNDWTSESSSSSVNLPLNEAGD